MDTKRKGFFIAGLESQAMIFPRHASKGARRDWAKARNKERPVTEKMTDTTKKPSELATEIFKAIKGVECYHEQLADTPTPTDFKMAIDAVLREHERRQWVSVKDRLPNVFDDVLWFSPEKVDCITQGHLTQKATIFSQEWDWNLDEFTHWRPLPLPPQEAK